MLNKLIDELNTIPPDWQLVPVGLNKRPLGYRWQNIPHNPLELQKLLLTHEGLVPVKNQLGEQYLAQCFGYGVLTGLEPDFLIAIDVDGWQGVKKLKELTKGTLPFTVQFTSGRSGRCQYLFRGSPNLYTTTFTDLQLRSSGLTSILPPSSHPITGNYQWVVSPSQQEVAPLPKCLETLMVRNERNFCVEKTDKVKHHFEAKPNSENEHHFDAHLAIEVLNKIPAEIADDYDTWLKVGMALKSINNDLLIHWDKWSQQSQKYEPNVCEYKWDSFRREGITIGTLFYYAGRGLNIKD